MYATHCLGTRFRLRLLQDSRQGGLPLLPPQVSNRRLLGRFLEGEPGNGTTLRVCAGWRLGLLFRRRDLEKLTAKQTASDLTEAEAIKQAQAGDAAAFEFLYKAHCRRVYSLCLRMIKNPAEAEDLTQQAFLQLFRKIGTFRGESGFSTWLHRVTVNIVLMHLRRHKPAEIPVEDLVRHSSSGEGPLEEGSDTSMLGAIDRLNLMRAIRKLPAGYKKLFLMHDVIGYQHSEIAGLLGCSTGCSKSQVHRARKRLRRLLLGETGQREPLGRDETIPSVARKLDRNSTDASPLEISDPISSN